MLQVSSTTPPSKVDQLITYDLAPSTRLPITEVVNICRFIFGMMESTLPDMRSFTTIILENSCPFGEGQALSESISKSLLEILVQK